MNRAADVTDAARPGTELGPPPAPIRDRDRYLDLWRAVALVRVVTYHVFGWVWLTVLFPAMGLMFALAGSLMANSLDRSGSRAVGRRLRRLLPPLWAFGAVTVPLMLLTGWGPAPGASLGWGELAWWVLPARTPPVGSQSWAWAFNSVLWYIVTYLWLVLLSPALLALYRRWPWPTIAAAAALPVAFVCNVVTIGGYFNEQALNISSYLACWLLGFAHHDGLLRRIPARRYAIGVAVLAVAGATWVLVAALRTGTFDLNRIPGGNTLWSMAFVATVLRVRPRLEWLERVRPLNRAVELLNARAVTVYLWHLPMGMIAALLLPPLTFPNWIGGIVIRLAGVWLLTIVAVAIFGWVEDIAARRTAALVPPPLGRRSAAPAATPRPAAARPPGNRWHRLMVTTVAALAVGLVTTAFNVSLTPTLSRDRQPQHEVTHYLSDLLLVLDGAAEPVPAQRDADVLPGTVTVDGEIYPRAVVTAAPSRLRVDPPAGCDQFHAVIKVGDGGGGADADEVTFSVRADERTVFDSGARTRASEAEQIDVDIAAARTVDLVTTGPARSSAIWADARFDCSP
ncbi:acyltransferase family protein [Micromonospora sp. NPDC049559]|uniref:acyltransferase family protein n=1 Tax=Micromonospora sp. NPDC049559 TaxID=3155923 RepID=UPI0034332C07